MVHWMCVQRPLRKESPGYTIVLFGKSAQLSTSVTIRFFFFSDDQKTLSGERGPSQEHKKISYELFI